MMHHAPVSTYAFLEDEPESDSFIAWGNVPCIASPIEEQRPMSLQHRTMPLACTDEQVS